MTNGEFIRNYWTDNCLASYLVRENTDCLGRRIFYGHFEGTAKNYLEAIKKEEAWLQEEYKDE